MLLQKKFVIFAFEGSCQHANNMTANCQILFYNSHMNDEKEWMACLMVKFGGLVFLLDID
jgi:hypothetical protein